MTTQAAETRAIRVGVLAVLLAGTVVRLLPFLASPSLYLDEAMLGLNLATRTPVGLLGPLDFEQSAPVLFLWLEWLALQVFGVTEHALRLVPLLSGLALGPLTWSFARRLLPPPGALLATAIASLSPLAVWYANVAKPYATDAAVATALLVLAFRTTERADEGARWLSVAAVLAPFVSAPSVFLLAGVFLWVALRSASRPSPVHRRRVVLLGTCLAAGFLANYLLFQRGVAGAAYLQRFYHAAFPWPPDPTLPQRLSELVSGMTQLFFFGRLLNPPAPLLAGTLVLAALGLLHIHRRGGWPLVALFTAPFAAVALAAVWRRYPPVERLLLFLTPLIVVLTAGGLVWLRDRLPRVGGALSVLAAVLLLGPALAYDARNALKPHGEGAEVAPVIAEYLEHRAPGEPVYVYGRGVPIWAFYTTDWSAPDTARLAGLFESARRIGPNSGNAPSRGRPVDREGFDLVVPSGDHVELIGIASGIEMRYGQSERRVPDPGWADNEVARMRQVGRPSIWLFLTHHSTPVESDLEEALQQAGGTITHERHDWAVRLWRVELR